MTENQSTRLYQAATQPTHLRRKYGRLRHNVFQIFYMFVMLILVPVVTDAQQAGIPADRNFSDHQWLPGYHLNKWKHPEIFQGNQKRKNYFEGWYFKMVSADESAIISVIPGISLSADGKEKHAFIQIIDGKTAETQYFSYPIDEFSFSRKDFAVRIGENYFSADQLQLNIQTETTRISGSITMSDQVRLPAKHLLNPGIMGWYRFVPGMQCYHGVVNLSSRLSGQLIIDGQSFHFENGSGYIEKDWGSSMPSAWIWMQSNNFTNPGSSFMLSVANIPWLGNSFTGFLGFFLHDGQVHRFATYTHASLNIHELNSDTLQIDISDKLYTYSITASRSHAGLLQAPVKGSMDRRIPESVDAVIRLIVRDRNQQIIYRDSTQTAGLEIVGDSSILMSQPIR